MRFPLFALLLMLASPAFAQSDPPEKESGTPTVRYSLRDGSSQLSSKDFDGVRVNHFIHSLIGLAFAMDRRGDPFPDACRLSVSLAG